MKQMGVEVPVFGFIADYMARPDGGDIKHAEMIHPKVEAEICIVTKAPLKGPGCHVAAVMAATDFVLPAVEVIDSRYRDFKFDLKSVIADNTSSSRFVIGGNMRKLDELDLRTLGVVLEINGEIRSMAAGAAVLGNPLAAVAMLANHLGARGQEIPAGTFIMTGGMTEAITVNPGDNVPVSTRQGRGRAGTGKVVLGRQAQPAPAAPGCSNPILNPVGFIVATARQAKCCPKKPRTGGGDNKRTISCHQSKTSPPCSTKSLEKSTSAALTRWFG